MGLLTGLLSGNSNNNDNKGYFVDPTALNESYPVGENGWYAIVGSTDTVWIWDADTNAWVNSGNSSSGDVTGPASATNNNIAVFDNTTGKLIKDGGASIASKQDQNNLLDSISGLAGNGIIARVNGNTATSREIEGGTGIIVVNGAGVSGNPEISLAGVFLRKGAILDYSLVNSGSGYTPGNYTAIGLTGGNGTRAEADITISSGGNLQEPLTIFSNEDGITSGDYQLNLTDNGGTGGQVKVTVGSKGKITAHSITNGGSGGMDGFYSFVPLISLSSQGFSAFADVNVIGGSVDSITVILQGENYQVNDTLTFVQANIPGLVNCVITVDGVSGIEAHTAILEAAGSGYTSGTFNISPADIGGVTGAVLTAQVTNSGYISSFQIVNNGTNYRANDELTADAIDIGAGTGFAISVNSVVNPILTA